MAANEQVVRAAFLLLRRLRQERAGNVVAIAAICLPLLVGAAGLAVDTTQWTYWRRQLQREADSAALAGAFAKAQSKDPVAAANSDLSRTNTILLSAADIHSAPTAGAFAGNAQAVRVSLTTTQRLPFSGSFLLATPAISASATAAVVSNGDYCALALGPSSTSAGIRMQGSASLNFGCGLATNSQAANAVSAGGSSSITATPVSAVGGLAASSNYVGGTQLLPYSLPQPDPFANLPTPAPSGCQGQVNVGPNSSQTLSPGCYRGMDLKGSVTLSPGTYYIDGGSFSVGSQATVTGDGVTIILTSSNAGTNPSSIAMLDVNGGATLQLTAPTSGTYKGILFYQDRRALDSGTNTLNGNASSKLQGALYFASQELDFTGTSGMTTDCLQLVAARLTFSGNTNVSNQCPAASGAASFKGVQVRLVE